MSADGRKLDMEVGKQPLAGPKTENGGLEAISRRRHIVILQVELATKGQARIMEWVVWTLLLLLFALSIVLFTRRGDILGEEGKPLQAKYYTAVLIVASVSLAALLGWGVLFMLRVVRVDQQHRLWSKRQRALAVDAAVQLAMQIISCVFWIVPTAAVVSSTCVFPSRIVAIMAMVRWTFFSGLLMWLLVMMHGMTQKQPPKMPAPPGRQLTINDSKLASSVGPGGGSSGSNSENVCKVQFADAAVSKSLHPVEVVQRAPRPQEPSALTLSEGSLAESEDCSGAGRSAAEVVGMSVAGTGSLQCCPSPNASNPLPVEASHSTLPPPEAAAASDQIAQMSLEESAENDSFKTRQPASSSASAVAAADAAPIASSPGWSPGSVAAAVLHDLAAQVPHVLSKQSSADELPSCSLKAGAPGCQLLIDGSWGEQARVHWPKLLMWGVLEVFMVLQTLRQLGSDQVEMAMSASCATNAIDSCKLAARDKAASILFVVLVVLYVLLYYLYMYRAFRDHSSLPYSHYRLTNIYIRVQLRHASATLAAVVFAMLVELGTAVNSCTAYLDSQMGSLPVQLALVIMVSATAFLYMPATSLGAPVVQSMLQQFSWTEADLPALRQRRNADLAAWLSERPTLEERLLPALLPHLVPSAAEAGAGAEAALAREPVFCMERAVRLFYWAKLAYQYGNPLSIVSESTALRLFGLSQYKCVHEPSTNIRGLLGWGGSNTVVLCFRGTASMQNVWTDIRSRQVVHSPRRREQGQVVRVHAGFYSAWRKGGFSERVLEAVQEVVEGGHTASEDMSLYLTGHSLGGALAVLAAYELRSLLPAARLSVYTFGAPRVGGRAWYLDYSRAVPDTWGVINSQDPVPRIPKLFYKRCGERVTVNPKGDIIVRPSYFELSVINTSDCNSCGKLCAAGGSVTHHMLWSYSLSLAAVMKAQFLPSKCLPGGESGVRGLVSALDVGEALLLDNMDLGALEDSAVPPKLKTVTRPQATSNPNGTLMDCSCAPWLCGGGRTPEGMKRQEGEVEEEGDQVRV